MSQEVITLFRYNGAEYEFDARDADEVKRMEAAVDQMGAEERDIPKDGRASDMYRAQCDMLKRFFDRILGEGAGVALCTEKNNIAVHYDAYEQFLAFVSAQKDDVVKARQTFRELATRPSQNKAKSISAPKKK